MTLFDKLLALTDKKCAGKKVNSWHEGYGLLAEEVDELWDEVKKKSYRRNRSNAILECAQIASLCKRFARMIEAEMK